MYDTGITETFNEAHLALHVEVSCNTGFVDIDYNCGPKAVQQLMLLYVLIK